MGQLALALLSRLTGLVAMLIEVFGRVDPQQLLNEGKPGSKENEPKAEPVHAVYA